MNPEYAINFARKKLDAIRESRGDNERAHQLEDGLHVYVLNEIACDHPLAKDLANVALESKQIPFERWCA